MKADEAQASSSSAAARRADFFGDSPAACCAARHALARGRAHRRRPRRCGYAQQAVFVRGTVDDWCCGSEVEVSSATGDGRPVCGHLQQAARHLRPLARRGPGRPVPRASHRPAPSLRAPCTRTSDGGRPFPFARPRCRLVYSSAPTRVQLEKVGPMSVIGNRGFFIPEARSRLNERSANDSRSDPPRCPSKKFTTPRIPDLAATNGIVADGSAGGQLRNPRLSHRGVAHAAARSTAKGRGREAPPLFSSRACTVGQDPSSPPLRT